MKKKILLYTAAIVVVLVVVLLFSSVYIAAENEYATIVRFSKFIKTTSDAGIYLKVPFHDN